MEIKENYLYKLIPGLHSKHEHPLDGATEQNPFYVGFRPIYDSTAGTKTKTHLSVLKVECQMSFLKCETTLTLYHYLLGNAKL